MNVVLSIIHDERRCFFCYYDKCFDMSQAYILNFQKLLKIQKVFHYEYDTQDSIFCYAFW